MGKTESKGKTGDQVAEGWKPGHPDRRKRVSWGYLLAAAVAAGVAAAVVGGGAALMITDRDRVIADLRAKGEDLQHQRDRLEAENTDLASRLESLLAEVRELNLKLDDTYLPVEVSRTVDFPVQRGMARPGDTVAAFARRERTTVPVLQALNPWVKDGSAPLQDRQSLWIPKAGGR